MPAALNRAAEAPYRAHLRCRPDGRRVVLDDGLAAVEKLARQGRGQDAPPCAPGASQSADRDREGKKGTGGPAGRALGAPSRPCAACMEIRPTSSRSGAIGSSSGHRGPARPPLVMSQTRGYGLPDRPHKARRSPPGRTPAPRRPKEAPPGCGHPRPPRGDQGSNQPEETGPARARPSRLDGAPPSPQPRARGGTEETAGGGTTPSGVDRIAPSGATALRRDTDRGSAGRRRRRRYRDRSRCSRPPPPVSP